MGERLGLLFSYGSVLVLAEGTDISTAWREAAEHDAGASESRTTVVLISLEIKAHCGPIARDTNDFK